MDPCPANLNPVDSLPRTVLVGPCYLLWCHVLDMRLLAVFRCAVNCVSEGLHVAVATIYSSTLHSLILILFFLSARIIYEHVDGRAGSLRLAKPAGSLV